MRAFIDNMGLKLVRLYTYHSPIRKGKYRLVNMALWLCKSPPEKIMSVTRDGRRFESNLTTGMQETVFFMGEYERAITCVISKMVEIGDVCLDVGANFGWYATLLSKLSGPSGSVHAFEPVPTIFSELKQNVLANGIGGNISINNEALGDAHGEVDLHVFSDQPTGHSSISTLGNTEFICYKSKLRTLDSYLDENKIENVNFVKVDIEGAEMMFLKGATNLFSQEVPPIFIIEMALETLKSFGFKPNDLILFIQRNFSYDFYVIDEVDFTLRKIDEFRGDDIGANVLCVPKGFYQDRLAKLKMSLAETQR